MPRKRARHNKVTTEHHTEGGGKWHSERDRLCYADAAEESPVERKLQVRKLWQRLAEERQKEERKQSHGVEHQRVGEATSVGKAEEANEYPYGGRVARG